MALAFEISVGVWLSQLDVDHSESRLRTSLCYVACPDAFGALDLLFRAKVRLLAQSVALVAR